MKKIDISDNVLTAIIYIAFVTAMCIVSCNP